MILSLPDDQMPRFPKLFYFVTIPQVFFTFFSPFLKFYFLKVSKISCFFSPKLSFNFPSFLLIFSPFLIFNIFVLFVNNNNYFFFVFGLLFWLTFFDAFSRELFDNALSGSIPVGFGKFLAVVWWYVVVANSTVSLMVECFLLLLF